MSTNTIRAGAGLLAGLALAAFTWPATNGADTAGAGETVQAAGLSDPVVVGPVDESAVIEGGDALQSLGEQIAARSAAAEEALAEQARAEEARAEEARALEAYAAAVEAAELEAYAAAVEAENLARLVAAIELQEAEDRRAAAAASAPAGSLEEIIRRHFGSAAPAAIRIAQCESSMNPNARSATNDHGLFQINAVHRGQFEAVTGAPWSSVYDPELNTIYARHLYGQQGWSPWTCA